LIPVYQLVSFQVVSANGLATEIRIPRDINEALNVVFEENHEIEIDA
jgi:hypothetical protein